MEESRLSFLVKKDLKDDLQELADYRGLSVSDTVREACRDALNRYRTELIQAHGMVDTILKTVESLRSDELLSEESKKRSIVKYHALLQDVVNGKSYQQLKKVAG